LNRIEQPTVSPPL